MASADPVEVMARAILAEEVARGTAAGAWEQHSERSRRQRLEEARAALGALAKAGFAVVRVDQAAPSALDPERDRLHLARLPLTRRE